jgi:CRP-like cAMP-binding protein
MQHQTNFLLSRFKPAVLSRLEPHLTTVELRQGAVIAEPHRRVDAVYFPHSGIISCVVELIGGGAIETGMIGKDGVFGAAQALDDKLSLNLVVMLVSGRSSVISSNRVRELAVEFPDFRALLVKYDQFFLAQVQQTAACNAVHMVQARLSKWLLRMHDLAGPDLALTQDFLAQMIGVRRTSVTEVARELQKAGMISYARGRIRIIDLDRIGTWACECDHEIRSHYRRIFDLDEKFEWSKVHGPMVS